LHVHRICIHFGVDGDCPNIQLFAGSNDTNGNLATIGYKNFLKHVEESCEDDAARAFRGANLVFGCYDLGMTPTQRTSHDALVIPYTILEQFFDYCLPGLDADQRRDPQHSPLYADLTGLPPALFTVGTLDPLLDDSLFMAARWRAADNEAHLAVYPESIHGFVAFPTELARRAVADITRFVDERIHAD
jgi:acetyl esterase/lipase